MFSYEKSQLTMNSFQNIEIAIAKAVESESSFPIHVLSSYREGMKHYIHTMTVKTLALSLKYLYPHLDWLC